MILNYVISVLSVCLYFPCHSFELYQRICCFWIRWCVCFMVMLPFPLPYNDWESADLSDRLETWAYHGMFYLVSLSWQVHHQEAEVLCHECVLNAAVHCRKVWLLCWISRLPLVLYAMRFLQQMNQLVKIIANVTCWTSRNCWKSRVVLGLSQRTTSHLCKWLTAAFLMPVCSLYQIMYYVT